MSTVKPQTGGGALALLALMALIASPAPAAIPPSIAYYFSSHPMISGTVTSVDDHQMVIDTDQGERVTLALDSRTMAPADFAPGMVVRADFEARENCRFLAERIIPVRDGMTLNRQQAYAQTRDSELLAGGAPAGDSRNRVAASSADAHGQPVKSHPADEAVAATPSTADYLYSTRPMISGQVVSVNDHRLVVDTEQGQRVSLTMDSRTMVPSEVAPGTNFHAEFKQMEDGRYYATRIWPVENGAAGREQAYAHTHDSDLALAQNTSGCGGSDVASLDAASSAAVEPDADSAPSDAAVASTSQPQSAGQPQPASQSQTADQPQTAAQPQTAGGPAELPHTASSQPTILLLGVLALACAGAISLARKRGSIRG